MTKESGRGARAALAVLLALALALSGCSLKGKEKKPSSSEDPSVDYSAGSEAPDEEEEQPDEQDEEESGGEEESSSSEESASSSSAANPSGASSTPGATNQGGGQAASQGGAASTAPSQPPPAASSKPQGQAAASSAASKAPSAAPTGTYSNVVYTQKGAYSKSAEYQNGLVKNGNIVLRNKVFHGDLTIEAGAGSGDITLEDVDVKGALKVEGGSGYLRLVDTHVKNLVLDKSGAKVVSSKKTDVDAVTVQKDASLYENNLTSGHGGFENITVDGSTKSATELTLKSVKAKNLTAETKARVNIDKNSVVSDFTANAVANLYGSGTVKKLGANVSGVTYEKKPTSISTKSGVNKPKQKDAADNWDDDDDWDDDYDNDKPDVRIQSIGSRTMTKGASETITVDSNAKTISASSSNTAVVSTRRSGDEVTLTAKKAGKATITITGTRSGYNSDRETFTVTVEDPGSGPITISAFRGIPTAWTNKDVTLSFDVTGANIKEVSAAPLALSRSGNTYSFTVTQNGRFLVTVKDTSNRTTSKYADVTMIDKTAPVISNLAINGLAVSFQVSDAVGSVLPAAVVVTDQAGRQFNPAAGANGAYSFTGQNGYTYVINCKDQAGNAAVPSPTFATNGGAATVEKPTFPAAPTVSDAASFKQKKAVRFTVNFPAGKPLTGTPTVSPAPVSAPTLTASATGSATYQFEVGAEGTYTITAANSDGAATASVKVEKIDTQAPQITVKANTTPGQAILTIKDDKSGLASVTSSDGSTIAFQSGDSLKNGDYKLTGTAGATYTVTARDGAGNVNNTFTIKLGEALAPVISEPGQVSNADGSTTVSFTVTDTSGTPLTVSVDKGINTLTPTGNQYRFNAPKSNSSVTYKITATNGGGKTATKDVTVAAAAVAAPVISEPGQVNNADGSTTVNFTVSDTSGTPLTVSVDNGINTLTPTGNQYHFTAPKSSSSVTYKITATNGGGKTATKDVTVAAAAVAAPVISEPGQVSNADGSTTVNFTVSDTSGTPLTVSVDNGINTLTPTGNQYHFTAPKSNSSVTYKITAANDAGKTSTKDVTVNAAPADAPAISEPGQVSNADGSTTVNFTVSDTSGTPLTVSVDNGINTLTPTGNQYHFTAPKSGGSVTYKITATNGAGKTATKDVTVAAVATPAPVIKNISQAVADDKQSTKVSFTVASGGGSLSVAVDNGIGTLPNPTPTGEEYAFTFNAPKDTVEKTYTITASNGAGDANKATQAVTVAPVFEAPVISAFTYSPDTDTTGSVTVTFTVTGDVSSVACADTSISVSNPSGSNYSFTVSKNGSYKITATGKDGTAPEATATVGNIIPKISTPSVAEASAWKQKKTISFTVQATEGISSVTVDNAANVEGGGTLTGSGGSYSFTAKANGTYTVTVITQSGKTATATATVEKIDNTKPAAPTLSGDGGALAAGSTSDYVGSALQVNYTSNVAGQSAQYLEYKVGTAADFTRGTPSDLPAGSTTTLTLRVTDEAGNSSAEQVYTIKVTGTSSVSLTAMNEPPVG